MRRPDVRFAHAWQRFFLQARAVPPAPPGGGARGATGTRAPLGDPGAGFLRPQQTRPGLLEGSPRSPLGPLRGPLGRLAAPALRRFCGPLQAAAGWLARSERPAGHVPLGGRRTPRHCWRFDGNGRSRASWISSPPTRGPLLPGADRCHAGCWYLRPVASSDGTGMRTAGSRGDKDLRFGSCALRQRHPRVARSARVRSA